MRGELAMPEGQVAVVVADGLDDQHVRAREVAVQRGQVGGRHLVHRPHVHDLGAGEPVLSVIV